MGMYRIEWDCCGSVSETDAYEPQKCPFCQPSLKQTIEAAVLSEREAIASWYDDTGYLLDESDIAAAIRAIKFEGDTGFRPVSEMIAEQEPVGYTNKEQLRLLKDPRNPIGMWTTPFQTNNVPLYAAPVSTKDLTDDDLRVCFKATNTSEPLAEGWLGLERFARAVIAADRKLNGVEK